ncbi:extracellular solute-binding protein [Clostridium sp. OS1-26]|uniref:ABC transporter substrate-binding protein n=1 Tax=Clostridium sp. OS1-26 TaxID=3070681 RepID=UPI0027DEC27B|nr:extracellular solute-binding protein [Clostridium sp. OS1-26]WML37509.1 extracellular solute-binding protein [Clostridium sp. OS1-26]
MKTVNFKYSLLITIFLFLSMLIACAKPSPQVNLPKDEEKIKLRCAMSSEDNAKLEVFKTFAADIKTQFPDYDVSFSFIKGDIQSYQTKIKVLLSSNDKPDVFFSNGDGFSNELLSANVVQPVDKYLDELKFWNMVIPSAKADGSDGHIYAVPFEEVYYQVIEINTALFEQNNIKPPTNFEEFKIAVSTFKAKGLMPIALGGKDGRTVYNVIEGFACTIDPQVTQKIINGKEKFSDESFKEAASSVKDLINMGAFGDNPKSLTDADAANLFYSGKAAMYCTSSSDFKISNQKLNGKCRLLYYPYIGKSKSIVSNNLVGGLRKNSGLFISSTSEHPKEAVKLAIEMSKYYNKYLYEKQGNPSVIYIPSKQNWKLPSNTPVSLQQFTEDLSINKNITIGLLQNNINVNASKAVIEDSSVFMTGLLSVDSYTRELDNGLKLK